MGQVVGLVPLRGDDDDAVVLGVLNRPPLRIPDCPLLGVVLAVEQPRVREVAVVGDVDPCLLTHLTLPTTERV
jgi:hypothetical protein